MKDIKTGEKYILDEQRLGELKEFFSESGHEMIKNSFIFTSNMWVYFVEIRPLGDNNNITIDMLTKFFKEYSSLRMAYIYIAEDTKRIYCLCWVQRNFTLQLLSTCNFEVKNVIQITSELEALAKFDFISKDFLVSKATSSQILKDNFLILNVSSVDFIHFAEFYDVFFLILLVIGGDLAKITHIPEDNLL